MKKYLSLLFILVSLSVFAGANAILQNTYTTNTQAAADLHVSQVIGGPTNGVTATAVTNIVLAVNSQYGVITNAQLLASLNILDDTNGTSWKSVDLSARKLYTFPYYFGAATVDWGLCYLFDLNGTKTVDWYGNHLYGTWTIDSYPAGNMTGTLPAASLPGNVVTNDTTVSTYCASAGITNPAAIQIIAGFVAQLKPPYAPASLWPVIVDNVFGKTPYINPSNPITLFGRTITVAGQVAGTFTPNGACITNAGAQWKVTLPNLTSNSITYSGQSYFLSHSLDIGLFDATTNNGCYLSSLDFGYISYVMSGGVSGQNNLQKLEYPNNYNGIWRNRGADYTGHSSFDWDVLTLNWDGNTNGSGFYNGVKMQANYSYIWNAPALGASLNTLILGSAGSDLLGNSGSQNLFHDALVTSRPLTQDEADAVFQAMRWLENGTKNIVIFGHSQSYAESGGNTNLGWTKFYAALPDVAASANVQNYSYAAQHFSDLTGSSAGTNILWAFRPASQGGCAKVTELDCFLYFGFNELVQATNNSGVITNGSDPYIESEYQAALNWIPSYVVPSVFNIQPPSTNSYSYGGYANNLAALTNAMAVNLWLATNGNYNVANVFDVGGLFSLPELNTNNFIDSSGSHFFGTNSVAGSLRKARLVAGKVTSQGSVYPAATAAVVNDYVFYAPPLVATNSTGIYSNAVASNGATSIPAGTYQVDGVMFARNRANSSGVGVTLAPLSAVPIVGMLNQFDYYTSSDPGTNVAFIQVANFDGIQVVSGTLDALGSNKNIFNYSNARYGISQTTTGTISFTNSMSLQWNVAQWWGGDNNPTNVATIYTNSVIHFHRIY